LVQVKVARRLRRKSGFSLIEAIIALFILLVGLLGLLGALNMAMNVETQSEIRNAMQTIIDKKRNEIEQALKEQQNATVCNNFNNPNEPITNSTISKYIQSYSIQTATQQQTSNTICIVNFSWSYKGKPESATRIIIVRKQ